MKNLGAAGRHLAERNKRTTTPPSSPDAKKSNEHPGSTTTRRRMMKAKKPAAAVSVSRLARSLAKDWAVLVLTTGLLGTLILAFWSHIPVPKEIKTSVWVRVGFPRIRRPGVVLSLNLDLGGTRLVVPPLALDPALEEEPQQPDWNDLKISFTGNSSIRVIWDETTGPGPHYRDMKHEFHYSSYYRWDDDAPPMPRFRLPRKGGTADDTANHCRILPLHREEFPVCNVFQELDLQNLVRTQQSKILGMGDFREVFSVQQETERYVLKSATFMHNDDFTFVELDWYRRDGVIGAAVGPHPLLADMYAYCAISLISGWLNMDMERAVLPHGRCEEPSQSQSPPPHLNITATQKLQYALDMAEGLALLHNHPRGVIVHDDLQLAQYLVAPNGRLKLNDFNRAEILKFDMESNEYCTYRNKYAPGDWRSPEEYLIFAPLNEMIDIYSLGNNFHSILAGVPPFPELCDNDEAARQVKDGKRSFLDPRWNSASYGEGKLVEIIQRCWEQDPRNRPNIGEIVSFLRLETEQHAKWEKQQRKD